MRSGWASGRSTTLRGTAIVFMPSCTCPTFSKMPLTTHMIQPDILLMRMTSPVVSAMAPVETSPWFHSHSASPVVPAISAPFIAVMVTSMALTIRPAMRILSVWLAMASRA
ncbi:hypothetical protein D3C87_1206360 [compost metagenome]